MRYVYFSTCVRLFHHPAVSWYSNSDAFQISKYHLVEPDAQLCCQLAESGFPSEYIAVALQLANKDMDTVCLRSPTLLI